VSIRTCRINVARLEITPTNTLKHDNPTKAALGILAKYDTGYIIGVTAHL
jgi:hypothetical protein